MWCGGIGWVRDLVCVMEAGEGGTWGKCYYVYMRSRTPPRPHTTQYTVHINFLYNCFLKIHVQPEDGYCWIAETCSCTLGSNVNTSLLSNKQVVLD